MRVALCLYGLTGSVDFGLGLGKPIDPRIGHYHHTKNEKFLVIKGSAKFRFRNILTNEKYEKDVKDDLLEVVETIPGWVHDISNSSDEVTIVMLWANEIFNQDQPDTIATAI